MSTPEPDLTSELDAAEEIVMGRAETVETEWGIRRDAAPERVWEYGTDEHRARKDQRAVSGGGSLVRRSVTYGPWTEVRQQREESGDA